MPDYSAYDYWEVERLNRQHLLEIKNDMSWTPKPNKSQIPSPDTAANLDSVRKIAKVLLAYCEGFISRDDAARRLDASEESLVAFLRGFKSGLAS